MGQLVYASIGSLDGFIADAQGNFDWSAPDEEVHAYLNDRDRGVTIELYGRRLYEVMKVWETYGQEPDAAAAEREYGEIWRGRDKVVYSSTLASIDTAHTRLEQQFEPDSVRRLVEETEGNVSIGGPELAAHALRAGLVDVVEYYSNPVIIGRGKPWLPDDLSVDLRLLEVHRFACGVVHLAYEVAR